MSAKELPEVAAFKELASLVRQMGDELATLRRRASVLEAQATEKPVARGRAERAGDGESGSMKTRLNRAEDRVEKMLERVRFLRQQLQADGDGGKG